MSCKRWVAIAVGLVLASSSASNRALAHDATVTSSPTCRCLTFQGKPGWCHPCGVGHIAGVRVPSRLLFEVIDAHGHDIDVASIRCPSCRDALRTDGFCKPCGRGYLGGQAYLSPLAYHAVKWAPLKTAASVPPCTACRVVPAEPRWCDSCARGRVGTLVCADRQDFEEASRAVALLLKAVLRLEKCERCAIATFTGGRCRLCKLAYREGDPVKADGPGGK